MKNAHVMVRLSSLQGSVLQLAVRRILAGVQQPSFEVLHSSARDCCVTKPGKVGG